MRELLHHIISGYNRIGTLVNRFLRLNITGILGTILFHLLFLIIFLGASMSKKQDYPTKEILIEFPQELNLDKIKALEKMKEDDKQVDAMSDRFLARNVAVNKGDLESKVKEEISTEKYIQDLEKQMNLPGFKALQEGNPPPDNPPSEDPKDAMNVGSQKEKTMKPDDKVYKGPTTILVDLANRKNRYVPVPVYKCQGRGTVFVEITVNQAGEVVSASANRQKSDALDDCLFETAVQYARRSLFSADASAPPQQKGSITYQFIAQ